MSLAIEMKELADKRSKEIKEQRLRDTETYLVRLLEDIRKEAECGRSEYTIETSYWDVNFLTKALEKEGFKVRWSNIDSHLYIQW